MLGPYNRISAEAVYALKPDLVIASMDGNDPSTVSTLKRLGLNVVLLNTQSISDIQKSIGIMAKLFNAESNLKITELKNALSENKTKNHPTVFMQVGWDPIVAAGKSSFLEELIVAAGGRNIFSDAINKYPKPNPEEVIKRNPEIIVLCPMKDDGSDAKAAKEFWSKFKNIKAVAKNQVHMIPADLLTKPGFSLIEGMTRLKKLINEYKNK